MINLKSTKNWFQIGQAQKSEYVVDNKCFQSHNRQNISKKEMGWLSATQNHTITSNTGRRKSFTKIFTTQQCWKHYNFLLPGSVINNVFSSEHQLVFFVKELRRNENKKKPKNWTISKTQKFIRFISRSGQSKLITIRKLICPDQNARTREASCVQNYTVIGTKKQE